MIFEIEYLDVLARALLLSAAGLLWVIALVRSVGLRSFSKMTSFDFVTTVAIGSLLAGAAQADQWASFTQALIAMLGLFLIQLVLARLRKSSDQVEHAIQNEPVLLISEGVILNHALEQTRVARSDLIAKLREANVLELSSVRAAVLETTGDVSVLHGQKLNSELLSGVKTIQS